MTLDVDALAGRLRRFCDPEDEDFEGFPDGPSAAADRWGDAFESYVRDLEVITPPTLTPKDSSATFAAVLNAFKAPLTFAPGFAADVGFATELSDAWAAGMGAIVLLPGATSYLPPPSVSAIANITPLQTSTAKTQLQSALLALFRAPSLAASERADQLAQALHIATTSAAVTTCEVTDTTSGTPVTLPQQPLVFG